MIHARNRMPKITLAAYIGAQNQRFVVSYPKLVDFVAADTDWPVGVGALVEPVRPPSRDEDVGGIRDVLAGEHLPQHFHDLCLGLVVRLLLNTP